jgi:dihydrofolate reductase
MLIYSMSVSVDGFITDRDGTAAALDATDKDVEIGGAGLASGAIELGLVDELHISATRSSSAGARRSCRRSPSTFRST